MIKLYLAENIYLTFSSWYFSGGEKNSILQHELSFHHLFFVSPLECILDRDNMRVPTQVDQWM